MKKFSLHFPPPPPPEVPEPESSSPGPQPQQSLYSPSRATSPTSDDDTELGSAPPPPPTAASLPPRKVLGSDQAKKRLQAFAKIKSINSPKRKSAPTFSEEEEHSENLKEVRIDRKKYPLVKEATPVMASIMKEETLSRDLVQKNMERKSKDEVDLRDLLNRKKREESNDFKESNLSKTSSTENISQEAGRPRGRSRDRRSSRSPSLEQSRSRDKAEMSRSSRLDVHNESLDDGKKRRKSSVKRSSASGEKNKRSVSREGGKRARKSGTRDTVSPDSSKTPKKKRRSSGASSKHSAGGSSPPAPSSNRKKTRAEKWNMPDLMEEMQKEKKAKKDVGSRDREERDKKLNKDLLEERKSRKDLKSPNEKDKKAKRENKDVADEKLKKSKKKLDNMEEKEIKSRKNDPWEDEEKKSRKDIDLWELKHGNKDSDVDMDVNDVDTTTELFQVENNTKNDMVLIKMNLAEDYFQVKNTNRESLVMGNFLEFPKKYMKETSQGVSYSYNVEVSKDKYLEAKKVSKLRKSIDNEMMMMMNELQNDSKKKLSREASLEQSDTFPSKKKRGSAAVEKKNKKRKKTEPETLSKTEKKKKLKAKKGKLNKSVTSEDTDSAKGSVALSAAGMSKLYTMAGYQAPVDTKKDNKEEKGSPPVKHDLKDSKHSKPSRGVRKVDQYSPSPSTPLQDDTEMASRSPSPSLIADLSRLSDRHDNGPRLPKMKDSRSPSKVPIMRDGRSPYKERRKDGEKNDARYSSPRSRGEASRDVSPGILYSPIRGSSPLGHASPGRRLDSPDPRPFSPHRESSFGRRKMSSPQQRRPRTPPSSEKGASINSLSPQKNQSRVTPESKSPVSRKVGKRSPSPIRKHASPGPRSPVGVRLQRTPSPPTKAPSPARAVSPGRSPVAGRRGNRTPSPSRRSPPPARHGNRTPSPRNQSGASPGLVLSPGRRSPLGRPRHPRTPSYSPGRRRSRSPGGRFSPRNREFDRRSPIGRHSGRYSPRMRDFDRMSPGRRRSRSPERRRSRSPPGRRSRSPFGRRSRSPVGRHSGRFSPLSRDREYIRRSPDRRRSRSPGRHYGRFSPRSRERDYDRRRYSPDIRDRSLPDSTISDAELARQMPPPGLYYKHRPGASPLPGPGYNDSPKRLSLDERLEREHGIKIDNETLAMDFSRPPPPIGAGGGLQPVLYSHPSYQPQPALPAVPGPASSRALVEIPAAAAAPSFSTGLPAMIPTYDDSAPPALVKGTAPYPGSQKLVNEKEQAMIAAQAIQSKLQEMQAAQKEEEKRKKEQKMAERIALLESNKSDKEETVSNTLTTGRILEEVEKQETEMKDGEKRKRKREKDSPMLITLKPFYRPNDKKNLKKRKLDNSEANDECIEDEEFTPRSPVPLPDNSNLRPVLRPYLSKSQDKKAVKYADGVLPGQGSPDQNLPACGASVTVPPAAGPEVAKGTRKKKYKKVRVTVITQHTGDTDSEAEEPPPPPPGSPPRYSYKELVMKYGTNHPVEATA